MATDRMDKSLGDSGVAPGGYYGSRVPRFPERSDHAAKEDYNPFDNPGFGGYYGDFYGRDYRYAPPSEREVGPYDRDEHIGWGRTGGHQEPTPRGEKPFRGVGPVGYRRSDDRI